MSIQIRHLSKSFGSFTALQDVNLDIREGELVALLGPSGSGKTTLLRLIAGLEAPDPNAESTLRFENEDVSRRPVRQRQVGFVFQHYALFRHMSVFENVAFGLRVKPRRQRPGRAKIRDRVRALLRLVQLDGLARRYPEQLSGGQRQRVALARALAVEPRVLLLDEPFGALDARVRSELRQWLRRLHDDLNITSVFVTHDQEEAFEVADRVVVMNHGRIVQIGTPEQVFHEPANEFVVGFLGEVNVFHGRVEGSRASLGPLEFKFSGEQALQASSARAFVRPHELEVDAHTNGRPSFPARVEHVNAAGPRVKIALRTNTGSLLNAEVSIERFQELELAPGKPVHVSVRDVRLFVDPVQQALDERFYALIGIRPVDA